MKNTAQGLPLEAQPTVAIPIAAAVYLAYKAKMPYIAVALAIVGGYFLGSGKVRNEQVPSAFPKPLLPLP